MSYGTPFVESEILLALSADDAAGAIVLLNDMTATERRQLAELGERLAEFCRTGIAARRAPLVQDDAPLLIPKSCKHCGSEVAP